MKADSIRIIVTTAAVIAAFAIFGHLALGMLVGFGVMCFMASEFTDKYNRNK